VPRISNITAILQHFNSGKVDISKT